jgi:DNA-binding NarL/FixJ family response regulator
MWNVFILYENTLFARGLERLLRLEGIKVVGIAMREKQALDRIRKLEPDVVIAEVASKKPESGFLLDRLSRELPRVAVVRVSLDDNRATLYTGHRWTANTADDLVKGILNSVPGTQRAFVPRQTARSRGHF